MRTLFETGQPGVNHGRIAPSAGYALPMQAAWVHDANDETGVGDADGNPWVFCLGVQGGCMGAPFEPLSHVTVASSIMSAYTLTDGMTLAISCNGVPLLIDGEPLVFHSDDQELGGGPLSSCTPVQAAAIINRQSAQEYAARLAAMLASPSEFLEPVAPRVIAGVLGSYSSAKLTLSTSRRNGDPATIEVTGGTSASALGFTAGVVHSGNDGTFGLSRLDKSEVSQVIDLTDAKLIRFAARSSVVEDPPSGLAWQLSILIDGVKVASETYTTARERVRTDLAANVSKLVGDHTVALRLQLVGVA